MERKDMVRNARLQLGESQVEFAKRFGVCANTVSRWETGMYKVSTAAVQWLESYASGNFRTVKTTHIHLADEQLKGIVTLINAETQANTANGDSAYNKFWENIKMSLGYAITR